MSLSWGEIVGINTEDNASIHDYVNRCLTGNLHIQGLHIHDRISVVGTVELLRELAERRAKLHFILCNGELFETEDRESRMVGKGCHRILTEYMQLMIGSASARDILDRPPIIHHSGNHPEQEHLDALHAVCPDVSSMVIKVAPRNAVETAVALALCERGTIDLNDPTVQWAREQFKTLNAARYKQIIFPNMK